MTLKGNSFSNSFADDPTRQLENSTTEIDFGGAFRAEVLYKSVLPQWCFTPGKEVDDKPEPSKESKSSGFRVENIPAAAATPEALRQRGKTDSADFLRQFNAEKVIVLKDGDSRIVCIDFENEQRIPVPDGGECKELKFAKSVKLKLTQSVDGKMILVSDVMNVTAVVDAPKDIQFLNSTVEAEVRMVAIKQVAEGLFMEVTGVKAGFVQMKRVRVAPAVALLGERAQKLFSDLEGMNEPTEEERKHVAEVQNENSDLSEILKIAAIGAGVGVSTGVALHLLNKRLGGKSSKPETKAPESKVPDTKAPDSKDPDSNVPETKAPDSKVPDTGGRDTSEPEGRAPRSGDNPVKPEAAPKARDERISFNGRDFSVVGRHLILPYLYVAPVQDGLKQRNSAVGGKFESMPETEFRKKFWVLNDDHFVDKINPTRIVHGRVENGTVIFSPAPDVEVYRQSGSRVRPRTTQGADSPAKPANAQPSDVRPNGRDTMDEAVKRINEGPARGDGNTTGDGRGKKPELAPSQAEKDLMKYLKQNLYGPMPEGWHIGVENLMRKGISEMVIGQQITIEQAKMLNEIVNNYANTTSAGDAARQRLYSIAANEGIKLAPLPAAEEILVSPFPEAKAGRGDSMSIRVTDRGIEVEHSGLGKTKTVFSREQLAEHIDAEMRALEQHVKDRGTPATSEEQKALKKMDDVSKAVHRGEPINSKLARALALDIVNVRTKGRGTSPGGTAFAGLAIGTAFLEYLNSGK
ncbi:MAG: hypothetical protein K2X93_15440 [Candidatus Obscuribacterales bacterium]|nr:hypothetical protein [Candidatus Obscuribacterales bacterium]